MNEAPSRPYRPKGANPLWARFADRYPTDWDQVSVGSMAHSFKGKLPKELFSDPQTGAKPYLLIDALFSNGGGAFTKETGLPECEEDDAIVVADGSRSGLAIRGKKGVLGSTLLAYRAKSNTDSDYLFYLIESLYEFLNKAPTGGAIPHLDQDLLNRLVLTVPKKPEQTCIAETLKAADDHIRALEEQIRKAERVKTALLQSLFVRGLPRRKNLRVGSRIGDVPAGWPVQRVSAAFAEPPFSGVSPESQPNPPGIPILNVGCVKDGICDPGAASYVDVDDETIRKCGARRGDFFVLRGNGNREYVGRGGWLRTEPPASCIFSDKLIRLRFDPQRVAEGFFAYLWQSRAFHKRLQSKAQSGSGLWMMTKRDIAREWVALPPKNEQEEIIVILDAASDNLASLGKQLGAAKRVKQSLLQNLLTGRIRLKP